MAKTYKLSEETRRRMSETRKRLGIKPPSWLGKKRPPRTPEHQEKINAANRGRRHTEEWKRAASERMKGNTIMLGRTLSPETRAKISASQKGKTIPESQRRLLSEMRKGSGNPMWRDADYRSLRDLRTSPAYKQWRKDVFHRDAYTCQICGETGKKLNANHIKTFSKYEELRFAITNGVALCVDCHRIVTNHEPEWESYFNFNLATRGFIPDEHLSMGVGKGAF